MPATPDATARRAALALIVGVTVVRLVALILTPLELYPDEAQYWLWSRELAFGYFSKPPMIAWLIALTTHLGGDSEPYVRASSVFLNAGTAAVLFFLGRRLYGSWTGFLAAALYALMPAVAVASLVVSADTPVLFFSSLALLAYAHLPPADGRPAHARNRILLGAAVGLALGLAMLSKYAALYVIAGLALHLVLDREARRVWSWQAQLAAAAAFALALAPNLAWNAGHHFQTVAHTASNANWDPGRLFNLRELGEFVAAQFGVFGPVPMGVLIIGAIVLARRKALAPADRFLLCVTLPALAVVTVQAFLARANVNWAAIAYVPASVLVAAWLLRWKARGWAIGALASQALIAVLFLAVILSPRFADTLGAANTLKRLRGWEQTAEAVTNQALAQQSIAGLSAVAVDDRLAFFSLRYYGRDYFDRPDAAPLRKWSSGGPASNQAEAAYGLTQAEGQRVLAVSVNQGRSADAKPDETKYLAMQRDFAVVTDKQIVRVRLDRKYVRRVAMFIGEGFRLKPAAPAKKD